MVASTNLSSESGNSDNVAIPEKRNVGIVYGLTLKIPVVGDIVQILNAYTYDGDLNADCQFAPPLCWLRKHLATLMLTALLTLLSTPPFWCTWIFEHFPFLSARGYSCTEILHLFPTPTDEDKRVMPGSLIISIFPNVLGFGLGVYALIFGLSSVLVERIHEKINKGRTENPNEVGSVLILNSDMAYPLLSITLSLAIAVAQTIFPNSRKLEIVTWSALWYSCLMTLDILNVLFGLGEHELLGKLGSRKKQNSEKD